MSSSAANSKCALFKSKTRRHNFIHICVFVQCSAAVRQCHTNAGIYALHKYKYICVLCYVVHNVQAHKKLRPKMRRVLVAVVMVVNNKPLQHYCIYNILCISSRFSYIFYDAMREKINIVTCKRDRTCSYL